SDISSINVIAGPVATLAGKSVTCNPVSGSLNCIVFGLNTTTIANGVVAIAQVTISPSTLNTSTVISLSGGVASDSAGAGITPVTTTGATLSITQPQSTQTITVATNPPGLSVVVDGTSFASSPQTFQWTPGSSHSLSVISPQNGSSTRYTFASWSD